MLSSNHPRLHILLVEDHADSLCMMQRLLGRLGHCVRAATNVAESIDLLNDEKFDLLISDIGLPDGTGHDVMRAARERDRHLRGIAVTGYGTEEDVRKSLSAGFGFHLKKPVDFPRLKELLYHD